MTIAEQTALDVAQKAPEASPSGSFDRLPKASVGDLERHALDSLTGVNWDFLGAVTNGATHSFHPYPARFIPQIPAALIQAFTYPSEVVYDPFVGGGTTCVEANLAGRDALGGDVNGLGVLITRVKTHPLPQEDAETVERTVIGARSRIEASEDENCEVPALSVEWFEDFVAREIAAIKREIEELQSEAARDFCLVALSAILVAVSKQDSDTRYTRVRKDLKPGDAVARYERQLRKMLRLMDAARDTLAHGVTQAKVSDSRIPGAFADNSADFIVTSPPYPNAYDYHLYHRHRLLWLNMDPAELKRQEIGAHAHYSRRNGLDENDFHDDMREVFRACARILKKGRHLALVVGDSILHGRRIRNNEIVKVAAAEVGFSSVAEFHRRIDSRRKSFNPAHGNIHEEDIVILRNDR